MPPFFRPLLLLLGLLCLPLRGAQCVVLGDSLTKEYQVEFPLLFPQNPASWSARNWIEILDEHRHAWFDIGRFSTYYPPDPRLTGHEHNWAFPGAKTTEIAAQLRLYDLFPWSTELDDQLKDSAERVVIFAGGNDVDEYYGPIYNGSSATSYINGTVSNLKAIVNYVRDVKSSLPIVLVSVPHLGCTPDIQRQYPTDPIKTARVTSALDSLNAQLAMFAQSKGIGFAPGVYQLTKDLISSPFRIRGIEFYKEADPDSRARYVFSGDGFHPATSAHAKIAQIVVEAFLTKYPSVQIPPLTDSEILSDVLDLNPNLPFQEWIAAFGLPSGQTGLQDDPDGDGLTNEAEFYIDGSSPAVASPGLFQPSVETAGPVKSLTWTYRLNPLAMEWAPAKLQHSTNLRIWSDVTTEQISANADGSSTVRLPLIDRSFLRVKVEH